MSQTRCLKGRRKDKMKKQIEVLNMIAEDMKNDAAAFDGRPFDGKTVAEYFGKHGAAIAAIADNLILIVKEEGE